MKPSGPSALILWIHLNFREGTIPSKADRTPSYLLNCTFSPPLPKNRNFLLAQNKTGHLDFKQSVSPSYALQPSSFPWPTAALCCTSKTCITIHLYAVDQCRGKGRGPYVHHVEHAELETGITNIMPIYTLGECWGRMEKSICCQSCELSRKLVGKLIEWVT